MRWSQALIAISASAIGVAGLACGKNPSNGGGGGGTSFLSGNTEIKDTFSHACQTDDDCVPVFFGHACGICNSSNGAIAKSDQAAYQKAANAANGHCPPERVVGECMASYGVTQCTPAKTCVYVSCGWHAPKDEHHCPPDGG